MQFQYKTCQTPAHKKLVIGVVKSKIGVAPSFKELRRINFKETMHFYFYEVYVHISAQPSLPKGHEIYNLVGSTLVNSTIDTIDLKHAPE